MSTPAISIVIPVYNAERTIDASIASALAQTEPSLELVIVDDGSTDATPAKLAGWAERDPRVRVIHQANAGASAARNTAIAACTAPYIGFLDADDLLMPLFAARMIAALERAPDAGFAYADAWLFEEANGRIRTLTSWEHYPHRPTAGASREQLLLALLESNFVMNSTVCRAEALSAVGGFDASLRGAEDWELWIRIVAGGYTAVPAEGCLIVGRDRAGSVSKDESMMWSSIGAVLRRYAGDERVPASARSLAARKAEESDRRRARVEAGGAMRVARRLAARYRNVKAVRFPRDEWLDRPPAEVAAAFPALARDYGRPLGNSW